MSDVIDTEGFRANVGIVLLRGTGQVFLGRRAGGRGWQFPQGGLRAGETPEEAALRELNEEVGVGEKDVRVIGGTREWLRYRLPARYRRKHQLPLCIGQKQRWFLLEVKSDEVQFDLESTAEPEFDRWRWVNYWDPVREIIYFKRPVYVEALQELAPAAFPRGAPAHPPWWQEIVASGQKAARKIGERKR